MLVDPKKVLYGYDDKPIKQGARTDEEVAAGVPDKREDATIGGVSIYLLGLEFANEKLKPDEMRRNNRLTRLFHKASPFEIKIEDVSLLQGLSARVHGHNVFVAYADALEALPNGEEKATKEV